MRNYVSSALLILAFCGAVGAQSVGPDVIVGDVSDTGNYGISGSTNAYSLGTTSCNIGTATLNWVSSTNQHPVIGQNLYRLKGGRFEQIGMSWLKHGFTALAQSLCATCQNPGTGSLLGIGCSDPYVASLNGQQSGLGPRWEVNAFTGAFTYPFTSPPIVATIGRRLQVATADVNPSLNTGAVYFGEAQYVTPDDAAAGNNFNNASWRTATFNSTSPFNMSLTGTTHRQESALYGWKNADPSVVIQNMDVPGEGRFEFAYARSVVSPGVWHFEICVHNLNSDRSGQSFMVTQPAGAVITNVDFHDVDYHPGDGDPYSLTDWTGTVTPTTGTEIRWSTQTFAANPNANALRWGTSYTFRFDSTSDTLVTANMDLFKPGSPSTVAINVCPPAPVFAPVVISYSNSAVAYDYVDFALLGATPTAGPNTDDGGVTANIGFTFPFYGQAVTQMVLSSNGYLTLPGSTPGVFTNPVIPSAAAPNGVIAGMWDDLGPNQGGTINYATVGTAPNRRFVANFVAVPRLNTTQLESFQMILEENGDIVLTCVSTGSGGSSATRGIEDPSGTGGIQLSRNTANSVVGGTSVRFVRSGVITPTALLTPVGTGLPNTNFGFQIASEPFKGLMLLLDFTSGPTSFGYLGSMDLGFTPSMIVLADFYGVFNGGVPDLSAATNFCGQWNYSVNVGPSGIPSGFTFYVQGLVFSSTAPNGLAHFTTPVTYTQP